MVIYINTNSAQGEQSVIINQIGASNMKYYSCMQKKLGEVENECSTCFLDLRMFDNSRVDLRSGGIIGLAYWFGMLIFALVDSKNTKLKENLLKIDAHVFNNEKQIINVIKGMSAKLLNAEYELRDKESVEKRNLYRKGFKDGVGLDIREMLFDNANDNANIEELKNALTEGRHGWFYKFGW